MGGIPLGIYIVGSSRKNAKAREQVGLPPLRRGRIRCLGCDRMFQSSDRCLNRICDRCKRMAEWGPTSRYNVVKAADIDTRWRRRRAASLTCSVESVERNPNDPL